MVALQKFNAGTVVEWRLLPGNIFNFVFWTFKPCIDGFSHCRPVISIDDTHVYGVYDIKLLIAVGMDVNVSIFPLVFAIAANKSNETWGMFLTHLRSYIIKDHMGICVLSDRHHDIFTQWLQWSINKKMACKDGDDQGSESKAYTWLKKIKVEKWTLYADEGWRWGTLTTNSSESFNDLLKSARGLPVTAMVRITFMQVVEWFVTRTKHVKAILAEGERWMPKSKKLMEHHREKCELLKMTEYNLAERVFEVRTGYYEDRGGNLHTVYEGTRTCSCGKWQAYHMPCSHAVKCFESIGKTVSSYVASEYNVKSYFKAYASHFYPLGDQAYWPNEPFSMAANKEYDAILVAPRSPMWNQGEELQGSQGVYMKMSTREHALAPFRRS
ncbi:uncharacterized protein LOC132628802 [Lycium barbarum]|uniref:uncharacterized protein LOC132628802 n=1 Tax=Lycium barbarum TaxID=112863 RepID=UPI00293F67B1|nr:uncharacterized protein LOC132628802 [Lycium barbarum]